MSKIIGVDASSISGISGLGTASGGVDPVPATTDSGIVVCPIDSNTYGPYSSVELRDYVNKTHMYQISSATGVVKLIDEFYAWGYLLSNGNFYIGGWGNGLYMGLSLTDANNAINNGGTYLALTNVSKVEPHNNGFIVIKTDGTLWWSGGIGSYLNTSGTGTASTYSNYGFTQVGTDTDWIDIKCYRNSPYSMLAIKGSTGSQYLYMCGQNQYYGTGLGINSGSTFQFTRVKSNSTTNLSESFSEIAVSAGECLAITEDGKLFSWGRNYRKTLGDGTATSKQYATQVGTDTDWSKCWIQSNGAFALKTDGTMHMSTSLTGWRIEPSTSGTFTQIGSDTDYQDIRLFNQIANNVGYTVFAKKNGSWYVSASTLSTGWHGSSESKAATTEGSWVSINDYLVANDITGTIDDILCYTNSVSNVYPQIMFALS